MCGIAARHRLIRLGDMLMDEDAKVTISLDQHELMELERIIMDREAEEALRFLKEHIQRKVEASEHSKLKRPVG